MKHKSTFSMRLTKVLATSLITLGLASMANAGDAWPNGNELVRGMCYQPIPTGKTPGQQCYLASDVCADQWNYIWGTGDLTQDGQDWDPTDSNACIPSTQATARNDIGAMQNMGVNVIRMYDWMECYQSCRWPVGQPSPNADHGKGHWAFLNYCESKGIKVILPISNSHLSDDEYGWGDGSQGGTLYKQHVDNILASASDDSGTLHPAIHSIEVGNELDKEWTWSTPYGWATGSGPNALTRACMTANYVLEQTPSQVMVTIPVSTADANTMKVCPAQSYFRVMRDGGTAKFLDSPTSTCDSAPTAGTLPQTLDAAHTIQEYDRFYNSWQAFQTGQGYQEVCIQPYDAAFPTGPPMIFTEWGRSAVDAGSEAHQAEQIMEGMYSMLQWIAANPGTNCKGICVFSWSNSWWKPGADAHYGINKQTGTNDGHLVSPEPVWLCGGWCGSSQGGNLAYYVDELSELVVPSTMVMKPGQPDVRGDQIQAAISKTWNPPLLGDANGDGVIDNVDLDALRELLGICPTDINVDGVTDIDDFSLFLVGFGTTCDAPARAALVGAHDALRRGALNHSRTNSQR